VTDRQTDTEIDRATLCVAIIIIIITGVHFGGGADSGSARFYQSVVGERYR